MKSDEKPLFYVATMLYNYQSGNLNRDVILKKVIESVLVVSNNEKMNCTELSMKILDTINMTVVEDEILDIISNKKNRGFAVDYAVSELRVCLKEERYNLIMNQNKRNMDSYIKEFIQLYGYSEKEKNLIEKYLYSFYRKNIDDLNILFGNNTSFIEKNVEFSPEDCTIIQEFIDWENDEKNEMFIAIANYALEYLLISGNNNLMGIKNIKNVFAGKNIYIDTNILFYCLGINGTEYEESNRAFLKKCKSCQEKIVISYYTDRELKSTISHFTNELERLNSPLIKNSHVNRRITNKDVYSYYITWSTKQKQLTDPKFFKQFLFSKYEKLIKEFDIKVETSIPFKEEELIKNEIFQEYDQEIPYNTEINYDARNVFLIESKRTPTEKDLKTVNSIFVSADKSLQRWDAERNKEAPVIVSPNIWLLLLARLISRSDNDFKCFISYINMANRESVISNKEYYEVVKVINEIIEDVNQQENVIDVMIEDEFSFLYNGDEKRTPEFIQEKTADEINRIINTEMKSLKKELATTKKDLAEVRSKFTDYEQDAQKTVKDSKKTESDLREEKALLEKENDSLNSELQSLKRKIKFTIGVLCILAVTIPAIIELTNIFILKNQNPLSYRLFNKIIEGSVCDKEDNRDLYTQLVGGGILLVTTIVDGVLTQIFIKKEKD